MYFGDDDEYSDILEKRNREFPSIEDEFPELKKLIGSGKKIVVDPKYLRSDKLMVFENRDKKFHEKWTRKRNMIDFPHPFRMINVGIPNSGKTTNTLNVIAMNAMSKKPFEKIYLLHNDPGQTEYRLVDTKHLTEIPIAQDFDRTKKNLLIIDDFPVRGLKGKAKENLNRLFGSVSTHNNLSIILSTQDPMDIPVDISRMANIFVVSKFPDINQRRAMAHRMGVNSKTFDKLQKKYLLGKKHEFLWYDGTDDSPSIIRLNGFKKLI